MQSILGGGMQQPIAIGMDGVFDEDDEKTVGDRGHHNSDDLLRLRERPGSGIGRFRSEARTSYRNQV